MESQQQPRTLIARLLLAIAALGAAYVAVASLLGVKLPGAGATHASFNQLLGLPVALFAAGLFMFVAWRTRGMVAGGRALIDQAARVGVLLILGFGLWFGALQFRDPSQLSVVALISSAFGIAAAVVLGVSSWARAGQPRSKDFGAICVTAALLFVATVAVQLRNAGSEISPTGPAYAGVQAKVPPLRHRMISLHGGKLQGRMRDFPYIGNPQARKLAVAVVDYSSKNGRGQVSTLRRVQAAFGEDLVIVLVPAGEERIHRAMLALWKLDESSHIALAGGLSSGQITPTLRRVLFEAEGVVGNERMFESLKDEDGSIARALEFGRDLRVANKKSTGSERLPQMVIGDRVLSASSTDAVQFASQIERELHLQLDSSIDLNATGRFAFEDGAVLSVGKLQSGEARYTEVMVRNEGSSPLKIDYLNVPKELSVVSLPKKPIAPGATASIGLEISASEDGGPFTHSFTTFHDGPMGAVRMTVTGNAPNSVAVR